MNSSKANLLLGSAIAIVLIGWGFHRFKPTAVPVLPPATAATTPAEDDGSDRPDRGEYVPPDDPALMNRVFDLETRLGEIDRTVWKGEMLSHRYGDVFTDLWDELRSSSDPFKTLGKFRFGELVLGSKDSQTSHEWEISVTRTAGETQRVDVDHWTQWLLAWQQAGYRLEASEWRHPQFDPPSEGSPARSVIQMTLFIEHPERKERITINGDLKVTWKEPEQPEGTPFPELIDASELTLTSRTGPPMFEHLFSRIVMPFTNSVFMDPVMAYDLNGDGLSEIILGCRNQVYWNQGNGRFEPGTLCRYRPERPFTMTLGDFDQDGQVDLLVADVIGIELYSGNAQGRFDEPGRPTWDAPEPLRNPFVFASGDIDRDGDLDVWLAQYQIPYTAGQMPTPYYDANDGFPGYLLLNDGAGNFTDATPGSGLADKRFRRAYSSSFIDLDEDGDLDLVIVSDFAGVDVYLNDGHGRFQDVTATHLDESHALGMAHTFGDYDLNGQMDIYVIGMISYAAQRMDHLAEGPPDLPEFQRMRPIATHGNRMYFAQKDGRYVQTPMGDQAARTGWSWGAVTADFDNDGDPDIQINNGQISRRTARDYETQFWRHDIYLADGKTNEARDVYFNMTQTRIFGQGWSYGGHEFNHFYLNENGRSFLQAAYQVGLALNRDFRGVVADDLDGDGRVDLLYGGFEPWPAMQSGFHVHRNNWQGAGNWIGFRLREEGGGFSPVGARINLALNDGRVLKRTLVTGDSYRSQSAPVAHFGIGHDTSVKHAEIIWSNGKSKILPAPAINQYHAVRGRQ